MVTCACALQSCVMCKQDDGFWLAPGRVKQKKTTSGPNPWFWAQNHGFGPDVVRFWLYIPSKTTKTYHIWPKPQVLRPRTMGLGQMWQVLVVNSPKQPKLTTSGPNPDSRAPNLGLARCGNWYLFWELKVPHLAQTRFLVRGTWAWAKCFHFWMFWKGEIRRVHEVQSEYDQVILNNLSKQSLGFWVYGERFRGRGFRETRNHQGKTRIVIGT